MLPNMLQRLFLFIFIASIASLGLWGFGYKDKPTDSIDSTPAPIVLLRPGTGDGEQNLQSHVPKSSTSIPVAICNFDTQKLSPAYKHLGSSLAEQLLAYLTNLPGRALQKAEQEYLGNWLLSELRTSSGAILAKEDEALSRGSLQKASSNELKTLVANRDKALRLYQLALSKNLADLDFNPLLDFSAAGELIGNEISYVQTEDTIIFAGKDKLFKDRSALYLVGGVMESVGNFITLRLIVDQLSTGIRVVDQRFDFYISEAQNALTPLANSMAQGLYGFLPASLTIKGTKPNSLFTLSPEVRGARGGFWPYVPEGTYTLRVDTPGYKSWEKEVLVQNGLAVVLDLTLVAKEIKKITIESSVPATLWDGAEYQGTTPYEYPVPETERFLVIKAKGYQKQVVRIGPEAKGRMVFVLHPDGISWDDEIKVQRDRVYTSLGIFALSLVVPIVFDGLYQNELQAARSAATYSEVNNDRGVSYYYVRNIGIVISSALLIDALYNVGMYVETANQMDYGRPSITAEE